MSGAQHTTQHTATQSGLLGYVALDAAYYNSIPDEVYLREWENARLEWLDENRRFAEVPGYTAAEREKIRIWHILSTHYESPYVDDGTSKSEANKARLAYLNGGAERNRLLDAQNSYGGCVPEYYQQEKLTHWSPKYIEGKNLDELRRYMSLWLRPLMTVGNVGAIRFILNAYSTVVRQEYARTVEMLTVLNTDLAPNQATDELEQFVASLVSTREGDEAGLSASEPPTTLPPTAPIAPPTV